MSATLIDGKGIAGEIREEIAREVKEFKDQNAIQPCLAAVLVGEDPASAVYVKGKQRDCEKAGIASTLHRLDADASQEKLLKLIDQLNEDQHTHGILLQLPVPDHIDSRCLLDAIDPLKDVDCFHPENVGLLSQGRARFSPCTPQGVVELLIRTNTPIAGSKVVILGRSDLVGKPLAMMLGQKNERGDATVTLCHSATLALQEHTMQADIVIAAIGQSRFLKENMVKPGAVVIDVGISREEKSLVGDVDFDRVSVVASKITPVPGGVGPMTRAMLLDNTLKAAKLQRFSDR